MLPSGFLSSANMFPIPQTSSESSSTPTTCQRNSIKQRAAPWDFYSQLCNTLSWLLRQQHRYLVIGQSLFETIPFLWSPVALFDLIGYILAISLGFPEVMPSSTFSFFRTRRTRKELRPAQTFDTMSLRLISERLCLMDDENWRIEKLFDRWKEQADWITKDCR